MGRMYFAKTRLKEKWAYLRSHAGFRHEPVGSLLRLAIWRLRCWLGAGKTIALHLAGARLYLPPRWHGTSKLIFAFREHFDLELRFVASHLPTGGVFVDAGANIGIYTAVAGRAVGDHGRVLAFEPGAEASDVLAHNVVINNLSNTRIFRCGLADKEGTARLYHQLDLSRYSLGKSEDQAEYEEIRLSPLDAILESESVQRVDCIKMDVEGAEELVLKGATSTLARWRPTIIFEVNPDAAKRLGLAPGGAWELLAALGYAFYSCEGAQALNQLQTLPPGVQNVVAIHSGPSRP